MRDMKRVGFAVAAALMIVGCGLSSLNVPALLPTPTAIAPTMTAINPTVTGTAIATYTPVPAPTQPPTPSFTPIATQPPAGTAISYGNLTLVIPSGLGSNTTNSVSTDVEFPYVNPSAGEMPEHVRVIINDYPVQDAVLPPEIMVFPAVQYAEYSDYTRQLIAALQANQYYDGQPLPAGLPDGPFNAQVLSVHFAEGHGIRYLSQFDQALMPVNNHELIYYFHGLTDSGNYYVEAVLSVQAAFLPADGNPSSPLPDGGVPFSVDNLGTYFQDIANKLNATPPGGFSPSLSALDQMIQSVKVGASQ